MSDAISDLTTSEPYNLLHAECVPQLHFYYSHRVILADVVHIPKSFYPVN